MEMDQMMALVGAKCILTSQPPVTSNCTTQKEYYHSSYRFVNKYRIINAVKFVVVIENNMYTIFNMKSLQLLFNL